MAYRIHWCVQRLLVSTQQVSNYKIFATLVSSYFFRTLSFPRFRVIKLNHKFCTNQPRVHQVFSVCMCLWKSFAVFVPFFTLLFILSFFPQFFPCKNSIKHILRQLYLSHFACYILFYALFRFSIFLLVFLFILIGSKRSLSISTINQLKLIIKIINFRCWFYLGSILPCCRRFRCCSKCCHTHSVRLSSNTVTS